MSKGNSSIAVHGATPYPWYHTRHADVQNAMTSAEALSLAGLDYDVLQEPVYDGLGAKVPGYRVNLKGDDRTSLGIVSDKYKVVQNTEAFAFVDGLIGPDCRFESAGSLNNYRTTWMLAQLKPRKIMGDDYNNYLLFQNSHDGGGAIKVCITPIRIVCRNMLNFAISSATRRFSIRHIGNVSGKLEEANRVLHLSEDYLVKCDEEYQKLALMRMNDLMFQKFLKDLFPISKDDSPKKIQNQLDMRNALADKYEVDDLSNFHGTAFGALNAVSDYVAHTEPLRMTDAYFGNLFQKCMEGHPVLDRAYELVYAMQ